jgi:hypothetical protein
MPFSDEVTYLGADSRPNVVRGAENHFCRKDGIDLESSENGCAACGLHRGIAARTPFDREQDRFFPLALVENFSLEPVAERALMCCR